MTRINPLQPFYLLMAIASAWLSVTPAHAQPPRDAQPVLFAQKIHNYCRSGESMFLALETKSYWVNICGGDNPNAYVGVNKRNRQSIRVPLKDFDPQGTFFRAVNKDVDYILAKTPRGNFLTVSRKTRELLREPVLKGW